MKFLCLTIVALALSLLAVRCGSDTTVEQRFKDSLGLPPPTLNVNLTDPNQFTFAFVGDLHIGNANVDRLNSILTGAAAEGDSFIIFLGDIVDTGDRADVHAFRNALSAGGWDKKTITVLGNHDVFNDGWTPWKDLNGPGTYTVAIGNTKFIVLDTASASLGDSQSDWYNQELAKALPSGVSNIIECTHYLPYVPRQRSYLKLSDDVESLRLMKLAATNNILAWLGGHYHSFIMDSQQGVNYVVAGGGGGRRMAPVFSFFFVQGKVSGTSITFQMNQIN
jgi:predicted phosphodiesterase